MGLRLVSEERRKRTAAMRVALSQLRTQHLQKELDSEACRLTPNSFLTVAHQRLSNVAQLCVYV